MSELGTTVTAVPLFADNYAFIIDAGEGAAAVIDPGDAGPVLAALRRLGLRAELVLLTHHHADHAGGADALRAATGAALAGPSDARLPRLDRALRDGDAVACGGLSFRALATPGHTRTHLCYACEAAGAVFTGDTLFGGGCGRLLEGTAAQLHASLQRLAQLPAATQVWFAHEYTEDNLEFALTVEPDNADTRRRLDEARRSGVTVPSSLALELATNPFLRTEEPAIRATLGLARATAVDVLAELRRRKDEF